MRMVSDRLCKEYQLSVVGQPEQGKGKHYAEWQAEQPVSYTHLDVYKRQECSRFVHYQ